MRSDNFSVCFINCKENSHATLFHLEFCDINSYNVEIKYNIINPSLEFGKA